MIKINHNIAQPIYKQIERSIRESISSGKLKQGDMLPSVNFIANKFSIARGSIFKSFNNFRTGGIIDSVPGKDYFVCQNYEGNMLTSNLHKLEKYKRVVFLFSSNSRSYGALTGFENFFKSYKMESAVVKDTLNFEFKNMISTLQMTIVIW